ncbi:MAG: hypothetical protein LUE61_08035 [Clostridiales bacterium]|nr:hypothetical protein [Clostridiales bacterium]
MKFSEMKYERPNLDALKGELSALTDRLKNAADYEAAKQVFLEMETLERHISTKSTLASVRHSIDTRDAFYDGESKFWNAAMPELQAHSQAWTLALLNSPFRADFAREYGELMFTNAELGLKAFSPEIVPELQQENDLTQEYEKLLASAQVPFEGRTYTLSQMTPSRTTRTTTAVWRPGRRRASGTRTIRRKWTPSMTGWYTSGTPWAKRWATRATPPWATTAWAATATPRRTWRSSGLPW